MKKSKITLIGHPFAPIGRGEDLRTAFRSFKKAGLYVKILDVFKCCERDRDIEREINDHLTERLGEINIFFINGDEIENVLKHLKTQLPENSYNIIYPAWELSIYPSGWAELIDKHFDEVWAQSRFTYESLKKAVSKPVLHLPLASQVEFSSFLSRRYFGIPESSYVFLFFFDFTSYIERKNPLGILKAFERVCPESPGEDVRLVIKIGGSSQKKREHRYFMEELQGFKYFDRVIIIDKTLSDNEIKNLVRCCDCFVSLHRSEGFGRGMAEAMCLAKAVVGTGYSGNLDFMNEENSCLVRYKLVPVKDGQYPHASGQIWAEPDADHAAEYMLKLLSDRNFGRRLGAVASRHMRQFFSYRAMGLRYRERTEKILNKERVELKQIKKKSKFKLSH